MAAMPRGDVAERVDTVGLAEEQGVEAQLDQTLAQLRRRARGVRGSVIADANGLAVAVVTMPEAEVSLLTLVEKSANLGILKIEMKRAARGIAEALGFAFGARANISELFVLHRDGLLIRHYSDALRTDLDRDILGGMLVGVQDFVKQTLATKDGTLDQMRYGDYTIYFVRGTDVIAAAVACEGDSESVQYRVMDALQEFEDRYRATLKTWTGDVNAFPGIDSCFERVLRA